MLSTIVWFVGHTQLFLGTFILIICWLKPLVLFCIETGSQEAQPNLMLLVTSILVPFLFWLKINTMTKATYRRKNSFGLVVPERVHHGSNCQACMAARTGSNAIISQLWAWSRVEARLSKFAPVPSFLQQGHFSETSPNVQPTKDQGSECLTPWKTFLTQTTTTLNFLSSCSTSRCCKYIHWPPQSVRYSTQTQGFMHTR